MMMLAKWIAATTILPATVPPGSMPGVAFGDGWGVNIHHAKTEEAAEIAHIARLGFKWVRVPIHWSGVEGNKGKYGFRHYDALVAQLERHRMRAIFTLCYGNPHYGGGPPKSEDQRRAFANYAKAVVRQYRGKGIVWELWNEPNYRMFWATPNAWEYMRLAREVRVAVDSVAPDEILMGPATSEMDWTFLQQCFDQGAIELFDAVSVHPYRQEQPETVLADYERLRRMMEAKGPRGRSMPIVNSEWGYSETFVNVDREKQGWLAPRMYLAGLAAGVRLNIHFDWKNMADHPKEEQRTFGVVDERLRARPAHREIETAMRELGGFDYVGRVPSGAHVFGLVFAKGREFRVAGWSTTARGTLRVGTRSFDVMQKPQYFRVDAEDVERFVPGSSPRRRVVRFDDWPPPIAKGLRKP